MQRDSIMDPLQKLIEAELSVRRDNKSGYLRICFRESPGANPLCEFVRQIPKIDELDFMNTDLNDAGLEKVGEVSEITELYINNTLVTGDGLRHLNRNWKLKILHCNPNNDPDLAARHVSEFPGLEEVILTDTGLTDEGLRHFRRLAQLKKLDVSDTRISGGIDALVGNCPLTTLSIGETSVDNQTCKSIAQIRTLKTLYAGQTKISDEGLLSLAELPELETLSIGNKIVTWQGLRSLSNVTTLKTLYLRGAVIGDHEVEVLCGMVQLKRLGIYDIAGFGSDGSTEIIHRTEISKDNVEKIRHSLPKCDVNSAYDGDDVD